MIMWRPDPASFRPPALRCHQPGVTRAGLDRSIAEFEVYLRDLPPYGPHLRWWIARYSRGDAITALREAFSDVVDQIERDGQDASEREGEGALLFAYGRGWIGRYRDALVLLSLALCLHRPDSARAVLRWCQRGDALVERLAEANGAPRVERVVAPPFLEEFDGLYAALAAFPVVAADALGKYLAVWCEDRMNGLSFKVSNEGIGYWCFEAAGIVAAHVLDDRVFRSHPLYPADLVAFYREGT